jgi:hypothetical protein
MSYDVLYNHMTQQQRDTVDEGIATATRGRWSWGMGYPRRRAASNHYGYHGDLGGLLAVIEDYKGRDGKTWNNIKQVLVDYFEVGFTPKGAYHEDIYGPNLGLRAGLRGLVVLARRGYNAFDTDLYRGLQRYVAYEYEPFPDGDFVDGASGGPGMLYPTSTIIAKYMYPYDPVVNHNYGYYGGDYDPDLPLSLAKTEMELSKFYPKRGKMYARSDWSYDALRLHFDARPDAFQIGHDTVGRGNFIISTLGRKWGERKAFRYTLDSRDHSLVHINGKGQPWKAPSVEFLDFQDTGKIVKASADLKYAYYWQCNLCANNCSRNLMRENSKYIKTFIRYYFTGDN